MTRVLSALVLLPVVIGTVWFLPPMATLVLALGGRARWRSSSTRAIACGARAPRCRAPSAARRSLAACVAVGRRGCAATDVGADDRDDRHRRARGRHRVSPGPGVLARRGGGAVSASLYIGLPLGALAAVRGRSAGARPSLLLLLAVIVVSDSAQYYTGRAFGRRPLAPAISPKKTVEGAIGGVVFGTLAMVVGGRCVFPDAGRAAARACSAPAISLLGIVGDLFESLLKRSAGVKDSSHLIPGHGGVLDRIDSCCSPRRSTTCSSATFSV